MRLPDGVGPDIGRADEPEHMDRAHRNQRLYETLRAMGLYVVPVKSREDGGGIEYLYVAAMPPRPEHCL